MDDGVRAQVRELLETGSPTEEVARQLGVPRGRVSAVKAHLTMGTYGASTSGVGSLSETDVEEIEDATRLKFGLERDMQEALRRNIHQLDPALHIIDEAKERRVASGFIDILAEDDQGSLVVIELKSGKAPESAVHPGPVVHRVPPGGGGVSTGARHTHRAGVHDAHEVCCSGRRDQARRVRIQLLLCHRGHR